MRARFIVASVSIAALLGTAACTTTDPYQSGPVRNNTGSGAIAGALGGALLGYLTNTSNGEQGRKNALIGAGVGALPLLAVVSVVVLGTDEYPSAITAAVLFGLNVAAFAVAEAVGYRAPAIPRSTEPESALSLALDAMQQTTITRFAITEAPAILSLVWAFATGSAWAYLVGGFWALLSMAWHVWPTQRITARLERGLHAEGVHSGL